MRRAYLFGLYAAFLWGTHSVTVQFLTSDLGAIEIATLRLVIAALTLFVVLKLLRQPISLPIHNGYFWLATGATFVNYLLFHLGLERTNAASAMVLENTAPLFVLVLLVIFERSPLKLADIAATLCAIIGVTLTVFQDLLSGGVRLVGDTMEIAAGASWAVFLYASSRAMHQAQTTPERLNFLFGIFTVTALMLTPLAAPHVTLPAPRDLLPLAFLGIFATALLYYFWYEAAALLSTMAATMMFALSVVFTFINAAIFLHQPVTITQLFGAAMIIAAVFISARAK